MREEQHMRLHRHDEIVEAMALSIVGYKGWGHMEGSDTQAAVRGWASAALDAMLEAAVRLEVGEVSDVVSGPKSYVALFLRVEASDDNA
jgi:hypothetical protein